MELYTFILGSVALLVNLYADKYEKDDLERTLKQFENDAALPRVRTYDYIIVGGGGAGCVLANRLSKAHTVLLLEAGGTPVPATDALFHYQYVSTVPRLNYVYHTVPLTQQSAAHGRVHVEHTGKMLGGSTSHNSLIFNRGHPQDFDKWAQITQDLTWSYTETLNYFKKSETYIGKYDNIKQMSQHGTQGPLIIDTASTLLLRRWLEAGTELGFNISFDPNGPQREGFAAEAVSQERGRRVSSYTAYLKHIEGTGEHRGLRVERYSDVSQILFKNKNRAYGVLYKRYGIPQIAHSSKTVIISAGTVGTPLLLMKSGIGPKAVLNEAGIPMVKDLPVGMGTGEHPVINMPPYTITENSQHLLINLKVNLTEDALVDFQNKGKGPLVISFEGQAFVVSSRAKRAGESGWPDLVLQFGQPLYFGDGILTNFLAVMLGRPKHSTPGSLSLNTTAYKQGIRSNEGLAVLDTNILTDASDLDVLVEGIRLWLKIVEKTSAFRLLEIKIQDPKIPACAGLHFRSDDYWKCYIVQTVELASHLLSGCRMGYGSDDPGAVLDSKFNVLGTDNLKVVDGSAMPMLPNANPVAAVVMMAEKAAKEILNENFGINNN